MSEKTVEISLWVPKNIIRFLEDMAKAELLGGFDTLKEYLEDAIVDRVRADLDADVFNPTKKAVMEKYGLTELFRGR